jgi:hydrogenase maturation protease
VRGPVGSAPPAGDQPRSGAPSTVPSAQVQRGDLLVLCLGNPLRSDDAVALHVARLLEAAPPPDATIKVSARAGLYLLDDMEGFDSVVVVDAIQTGQHPPGTVHALPLEQLHSPSGPSPHAVGLPSALALARASGAPVPARVELVLVEVEVFDLIGERLTPAVAAAVGPAAEAVRAACERFSR